jgi:replicative superfamily II helicase
MFRGLFVGIDRYPTPVNRLTCARADALALSTLFEDNFSGEVVTMLDGDATLAAIRGGLETLTTAAEDDLVVVTFSGHGSEDHRLLPVDVIPDRLAESCLSLDELAQRLDVIPSKQLLVVLDCCFSGGFGGSRFFSPMSRRGMIEDVTPLQRLARGDGRVVLTASGAGEPALETSTYGHGLLTYHLIQGLQGQEGTVQDGRISLLSLFNYIMVRVLNSAERLGEVQTPTLYGSLEGAPTLAVLVAGSHYSSAFPGRVRAPINGSWASLRPYGIPEDVIEAWSAIMPGPNELQQRAVNEFGVLAGNSLVVAAPTAAGKTMIGELAAIRTVTNGSRTVMLLPMKALVSDKYEYFRRTYGDRLAVVRATGDHSDQVEALLAGQYDLALLTYEKFMSLVIGNPFVMRGVALVVVDEVQTISDQNRGPSLEFLMTLIRSGLGRGGSPQVVALSAVIGDTNGLERWLGANLLRSDYRPIPLRESVLSGYGGVRHRLPDGGETSEPNFVAPVWVEGGEGHKHVLIPLVRRLVTEGKKVIVFREIRGKTVGTATYLAGALGLPQATEVLNTLPGVDRSASSDALRRVLQAGVAFHNSDLDRDERRVLEEHFRDPASPLRVMVATTTLAMGINTPAEAVVIAGLTHPGGNPYSIAEYKNMAGRAGRPGHGLSGEAYIVAASDIGPDQAWQRYVQGAPEPIISHFLSETTDPQTLTLRSIAALGNSVAESTLVELLENSFAIWRRRETGAPGGWDAAGLARDLAALVQAGLLDREPSGQLTLTELGRFAGSSGIEVRSVTQVSSALRFVTRELRHPDLLTLAQVTVELDAVLLPVHRRSRQEQARWPAWLRNAGVDPGILNALHVGGGEPVARAKRSAACVLWTSSEPMAVIEAELLQHLRERSVSGPLRQVAARTRDVVDSVAVIAQLRGCPVSEEAVNNVGLSLELGLPLQMMPLAREVGDSLSRGQYLDLLRAGLTTGDQVRAVSVGALSTIVGKADAEKLLSGAPWLARIS